MAHSDREERAARNEALFREVNDRIGELNEAFAQFTDVYEIACECSNIECIAVLTIGRTEYLVARQSPRTFVVLPEHVVTDLERVVSEHEGCVVVEKLGEAGELATEISNRD